jgi:AcrR family transcriptional regulator
MPANLPSRSHDPGRRQNSLVDAATACFAERGFDAATTREIAERSGCSEGLIHRYFGGKRGLLAAVLQQKTDDIVRGFESLPYLDGLYEDVEALLLWTLDTMWERRQFMRVAVAQTLLDRDLGAQLGLRLNRARVAAIRSRLERHHAAGQVRPGADLQVVAELMAGLALHFGFFNQVVWEMGRDEARRQALAALSAVIDGLALPGSGDAS